ncbi:unnamed protein product [Durusdinium trenchii]|uniref:Uncharacterized protein n=1 Tax=Durusdinium trenchii TaxID=1381693 RepID=A0ABP0KK66_9DINO
MLEPAASRMFLSPCLSYSLSEHTLLPACTSFVHLGFYWLVNPDHLALGASRHHCTAGHCWSLLPHLPRMPHAWLDNAWLLAIFCMAYLCTLFHWLHRTLGLLL